MTRRRLCDLGDLPEGRAAVFDLGDVRVAAARSGETVFVLEDRCSHDDGELGAGDLRGDHEIECPRHGARFDVRTGRPTRMPAVAPVETFEATVEDGVVFVEVPEW